MNDNVSNYILCPFYVCHNKGSGNNITVTCENICKNVGFEVCNKLSFRSFRERADWMELFCMDMYMQCPYYKGIYSEKYEEDRYGNRKGAEKRDRKAKRKN